MSKTICKWLEDDEQILIGPDGQVLPCCYLSAFFTLDNVAPKEDPDTWVVDPIGDQLYYKDLVYSEHRNEHIYIEYQKRKDKLNIFTNSLEDIIANDWFTKILPESWENENTISKQCKNVCTKCDE